MYRLNKSDICIFINGRRDATICAQLDGLSLLSQSLQSVSASGLHWTHSYRPSDNACSLVQHHISPDDSGRSDAKFIRSRANDSICCKTTSFTHRPWLIRDKFPYSGRGQGIHQHVCKYRVITRSRILSRQCGGNVTCVANYLLLQLSQKTNAQVINVVLPRIV